MCLLEKRAVWVVVPVFLFTVACDKDEDRSAQVLQDEAAAAEQALDEALEAGDADAAEQLLIQTEELRGWQDDNRRYLLAQLFLHPRGAHTPRRGGRFLSVLDAIPHSDGILRCSSGGPANVISVLERQPQRARQYLTGRSGRLPLEVAMSLQDLQLYDEALATQAEPGANWLLNRLRLLWALDRPDDALAYASTILDSMGDDIQRCEPRFMAARIQEERMAYSEARTTYSEAHRDGTITSRCGRSAAARSEALTGMEDGQPLPGFPVMARVDGPLSGDEQVIPYLIATVLPDGIISFIQFDTTNDYDLMSPDFASEMIVIQGEAESHRLRFESVPPGYWALVLRIEGPTGYQPNTDEGCWPLIHVVDAPVDVSSEPAGFRSVPIRGLVE